MPKSVSIFVTALVAVATAVAVVSQVTYGSSLADWPMLFVFFALVVGAESLDVHFRFHGQVESLNLSEAVLAPFIFAFAGAPAMAVIAVAHLAVGVARRNQLIKTVFNATQWSLAAGLGSLALTGIGDGQSVTVRNIAALLVAMIIVGVTNQVALTTVLSLAQNRSIADVIKNLGRMILPGWLVAWGLNTLVGVLFVMAYASSPLAAVLFFVPLFVLYVAYRGYAGMESDRTRLAGLHRASHFLASAPAAGDRTVGQFLAEVCRSFEAGSAELILLGTDGATVHRVHGADPNTYQKTNATKDPTSLRTLLIKQNETTRVRAGANTPLAMALADENSRDCLMAPLPKDNGVAGLLAVFDRDGIEGFEDGEAAVLEALARETASSFEKGRLFAAIVEERGRLSQIVDTTSDGVLTLDAEGVVRSCNPGWEQITGYRAKTTIGRALVDTLALFDGDGRVLSLRDWADNFAGLPGEVQLMDRSGTVHQLECAYRAEVDGTDGSSVLVIVMRDLTDEREIEQLREDVDRLAELEAVQRAAVLQLQESLQPKTPVADETEFGVYYLPSDTTAPTGGDFYDWQSLPGGDVHIAVVDVLGSGIEATNDALAVIHTLRTLAYQGVPVERLVREADELLGVLDTELVATAICLRYNPATGKARLAGGGHPPPLLVHANGEVEEVPAPGIPIGWPGAGSSHPVDVTLRSSDTLVLYTDGLVEARRDILLGLEELAETASEARHYPAPQLARALVERSLDGADRRDDSLALVVRRWSPTPVMRGPYEFSYRGKPANDEVPAARHEFHDWLSRQGELAVLDADLCLVVSELVTNAVKAAGSYFEIRGAVAGEQVVLEVEDDGLGFEDQIVSFQSDFEDESGRGLFIVKSVVDDLSIQTVNGHTVVRLSKKAPEVGSNRSAESQRSSSVAQ